MANVVGPSDATPQPSTTATQPPALNVQSATVWLIGLGGTWVILTLLAEFDDTRVLAVALAVVLLGSVLATHGPQALQNLGVL